MNTDAKDLERALLARVSHRVRTAGAKVDSAAVEHIVRDVVERLMSADSGGSDTGEAGDRALLVLVVDAPAGPGELAALQSAMRRAASPAGARVLAAHAEPLGG